MPSERCTKTLPFGCIYEEFLLKNDLVNEITLTQNNGNSSSSSAPAAPAADPTDCQRACYALFPNAYFVGVRQTDDDGSVKCFCAKMGAFKSKVGWVAGRVLGTGRRPIYRVVHHLGGLG